MVDKLMRVAKKMYKGSGALKKDGFHRPEAAGNFDNMDDYNFVDSINVNTGTIQEDPVNEKDIVNKEYVDSVAGRGSLDLFLTENSSDIGTYFDLEVDIVTAAKENIVQSITASSTTLIASFASILNNSTINDITLLESGIYNMHLHVEGANANNLFVYFEFYHRTAGGTETLLGTSHDSGELTTGEINYDLHAIIASEQAFVSGDRIVVKVYGRNNAAAARNITIYMEGDTASRVEFPALLNVQTVFWNRAGTVLSPKTAGDNIETTGAGVFEGLNPYNSGTADLGSGAFKWRSLFLSSDASVGGNINVTGTVDGIDIATDVVANTTHRGSAGGTDHSDVNTNNAKVTNVTTNLSAGTRTATTIKVDSSDGTDATLVEADTTNAGLLGSDKWDEIVANSVHTADNTQAHSDYLLNSAADVGVGLSLTGDNASADTTYVPNVLYNTDATPPTASTVPIGTIYVQYTA